MTQTAQSDFDMFYDRTYATTLRRARVLCGGDHHLAEDLAAEAYLAAWRRWTRIGDYENPEAWMYRAIRQRFLKLWYRRSRLRAGLAKQPPAAAATLPEEPDITMGAILAAVHDLPARQREAVIRRHFEHQTTAEIAVAMGITTGAVAAHLHKARQRLAKALGRGSSVVSGADELVSGGGLWSWADEQTLNVMLGAVGEALRVVYERDWVTRDRVRCRVDELIDRENLRI